MELRPMDIKARLVRAHTSQFETARELGVFNAMMDLLTYLEGMEAVTNSQPVAQETACPFCRRLRGAGHAYWCNTGGEIAHRFPTPTDLPQETTTDAPGCSHWPVVRLLAQDGKEAAGYCRDCGVDMVLRWVPAGSA